ncbi:MAG TPA: AAA family ATPase, partial [Terriglobia bacterium]|nr:AAA family ATPase [Terriglobia bacterium]
PLVHSELADAVARVKVRQGGQSAVTRGQVWTFLGAKGGLGVTSLAAHLASLLAKVHGRKTLLVDHHPQLGEVSFYLALERKPYHFSGLVENSHRLDSELLQGYLVHHPSGLDVLPCPDGFDAAGPGSALEIERTLAFLSTRYEFALVDCPPGLNQANMAAIQQADRVYLVVTPEVSALDHVRHYLECLDQWQVSGEKVRLVVNRYSEKGITEAQIQKVTRRQVAWKVPNQYQTVIQAINAGTPISLSSSSQFMQNLHQWAEILANKRDEVAERRDLAKGKAANSILSLKPAAGR